jgi:hypothetical protein
MVASGRVKRKYSPNAVADDLRRETMAVAISDDI